VFASTSFLKLCYKNVLISLSVIRWKLTFKQKVFEPCLVFDKEERGISNGNGLDDILSHVVHDPQLVVCLGKIHFKIICGFFSSTISLRSKRFVGAFKAFFAFCPHQFSNDLLQYNNHYSMLPSNRPLYLPSLGRTNSEIWPWHSKFSDNYDVEMLTFSVEYPLRNLNFWKGHTLPSIRTSGPESDHGNKCVIHRTFQNPSHMYLTIKIIQVVRCSNRK